ncbi:hypothetical protein TNCV_3786571 [Trichonephila clavipes]|nr:hypothetical protein TNCV_3786571 [Trichonephila clavipes]
MYATLLVGGEISVSGADSTNHKEITQSSEIYFLYCCRVSCRSDLTKRIFPLSDFAMTSLDQLANIKFCVLLEKSPETIEMLKKVFENDSSTRGF